MEIKSLSPKYIFKKSFLLTKDIYYQLLLLCIPTFLIFTLWIHKPSPFVAVASLLTFSYFTLASTLYILGKINSYDKGIYEILVKSRNLFPRVLLWKFLTICILTPAFGLFIIPGIYLSCRFVFSFFLIAEENFPAIESFRHSWDITKKNFGRIIQNGVIFFCVYSSLALLLIINLSNLSKTIFLLSLLTFVNPLLLVHGTLVFKGTTYLELRDKQDINTLKKLEIEDDKIEFNGHLEAKDFWNFQRAHLSKILWTVVTILAIPLGLPSLRIFTSESRTTSEIITIFIGTFFLPALLLLLFVLVLLLNMKRVFKSNRLINSQISGYVHRKGLKLNSKYSKSEYSWEAFISYRELQDLLLLYVANNQAFLFPKRFFETEDDWEIFKLIVTNKISKKLS
ncbi:MAG: YcxB family protein [Leptolyngbya sp. SIO1E4]|nr:YcxB family protein [Leptolyngbya sp. SIO1E4]